MPDFPDSPTNDAPGAAPSDNPSNLQPKKISVAVCEAIDDLRRQTEYGKRLSRLCQLHYYLRPFPPQLQAEWDRKKSFKTAPVNRNSDTVVRKGKWREEDDTKPGAAQHVLDYLLSFFGYLALPLKASPEALRHIDKLGFSDNAKHEIDRRSWAIQCMQGKGLDPANFSLAYLTDANWVLDHLDFKKIRSGVYSGGTMWALSFVMSLLREGTGYLRQQPHFGLLLPTPITTPEEWDAWCAKNLRILSQAGRDLIEDDQVTMSRDPTEPIADILALQSPANVLFKLAAAIYRDTPKCATELSQAVHYRNYLFVRMLPFSPLRIKHYSDMQLGKNLYRTADGAWRMFFPAKAFKNERGASKKDYDVPVDPVLWPIIEEYVNKHRPLLAGGSDPNGYVFLKGKDYGDEDGPESYRIKQSAFRQILHRLTGTYLGVIFGPHAVRHIMATTILRQRPNDWQTAADALHDTQETVRRRYAHLAVEDGVATVNRFVSGLLEAYHNAA